MKLCSVSGCGLKAEGYSPLCNTHKRALQRHGHPLMDGVQATELKPYTARVSSRMRKNEGSRVWEILRANWRALADHSRGCQARILQGEPYNRTEARAHNEFVKLDDAVEPLEIMKVVMALYLLQHERPSRFPSDDAFRFQLVRRVIRLTDINVGVSHNHKTGRAVRVYRDLPPRVSRLLGSWLAEAFGGAGVYLAGLDTTEKRSASTKAAELQAALESLA